MLRVAPLNEMTLGRFQGKEEKEDSTADDDDGRGDSVYTVSGY